MDDMLLARARQRDAAAFEALVTPHERLVWRVCCQMMGSTEDAADAAQEAMIRAWRAMPSYRGEAELSTWLYRIAVRCCLDALRRRKARPAESLDSLREAGYDPPDAGEQPDEALLRRESREELRRALLSLPEEQRVPLTLFAVEGRSYEEIAELTASPLGTVKSRVSRARRALQKIIAGPGNNPEPEPSKKEKGGRRHEL